MRGQYKLYWDKNEISYNDLVKKLEDNYLIQIDEWCSTPDYDKIDRVIANAKAQARQKGCLSTTIIYNNGTFSCRYVKGVKNE